MTINPGQKPTTGGLSPPTWYLQLEAKRRFIIGSVLIICIAILVVISLRNPVDYDSYWHLQMGKDLVENGLSPYKDHYSFTYQNETITGPPVLFQVGLYGLVNLFGEWGGYIALKMFAFMLAFGCMLAWLKQIKAPVLAYCLVLPMLVMLLELRAQVRPELFGYSFGILALMLYQRAQLRLTVKAIAPIALLLLIWTNYHSSIFGYIIFFGLFIDIGLKLINEKAGMKPWLVWAGWGVLLVGVGFVNPSLSHPVYGALTFPDAWKILIHEYQPPYKLLKGIPSIYVLAGLALMTLLMALRQRKFGYLVIAGVMLYGGLTMIRLVTPAGIVLLGIFAHLLSGEKLKNTLEASEKRLPRLALLASLIAFVIPMWDSITYARASMIGNTARLIKYPEQLVSYMLKNDMSGRIFNEYHLGGYLIYHLSPDSQVYIDGRAGILYPVHHYVSHDIARGNGKVLAKEIEKYGIDFVILNSDAYSAWTILQVGELGLDFVDIKSALWTKDSPRLPTTGRLWARPYCWTAEQAPKLADEWQIAQSDFPPIAPIMPLLALATDYAAADDPDVWLMSLDPEDTWNDESKRFVGYRALEHQLNDIAIELFSAIATMDVKDYLATALANARNGQFDSAEQALELASRQQWARLQFNDLVVMQALLAEIQQHRALQYMDPAFVESIFTQVSDSALSTKEQPVSVASFCGPR